MFGASTTMVVDTVWFGVTLCVRAVADPTVGYAAHEARTHNSNSPAVAKTAIVGHERQNKIMAQFDQAHKDAIQESHRQNKAVRRYLEMLEQDNAPRPKPVDVDGLRGQLAGIDQEIAAEASTVKKLDLVQKRQNVQSKIDAASVQDDTVDDQTRREIEDQFVKMAAGYGQRKGISYKAWREVGVPVQTLKAAGLTYRS